MGVVSVVKSWDSGGRFKLDEQGNQSWGFTTIYSVVLDDPTNGEQAATFATGLPAKGDYYPNSNALMVSKEAKALGPYHFQVVCEYSGMQNPLTSVRKRQWGSSKSTEPIDRDINGNAILNPNGERYVGLVGEASDRVFVITRNVSNNDKNDHATYQDAVNSAAFMGSAQYKARVVDISHEEVNDGNGANWYWRETIRVQFRVKDDWRLRILVEGHQYWTGNLLSDGRKELKPFKLGNSDENDPRPHPLAADGKRLADETNVALHVWEYKDIYPLKDLNGLGIHI